VTNGSVTALDALAFAAKIIRDQMKIFVNFQEDEDYEDRAGRAADQQDFSDNLYKSVDELELS